MVGKEVRDEAETVPGTVVYYQGTLRTHADRSTEQSDTWYIHRCKTCSVRIGRPYLDAMDQPRDQWDADIRNNPC